MKRSQRIKLVLFGGMTSGVLVGCGPSRDSNQPVINAENTYTNNYYVRGAGYYHAPYRGWYEYPYNYYAPGRGYYHGGSWTADPHASPTVASQPTVEAANSARANSKPASCGNTRRSGFGKSSHSIGS